VARKLIADSTPITARKIRKEAQFEEKTKEKMGPWATAFTIFKGFVACSMLYMPKNFINGGWGFSPIMMIGSLFLTLYCAKLLLDTRAKLGGKVSFSEMGEITWGKPGRIFVDVTLVGS